jgi:hypothetical protein
MLIFILCVVVEKLSVGMMKAGREAGGTLKRHVKTGASIRELPSQV